MIKQLAPIALLSLLVSCNKAPDVLPTTVTLFKDPGLDVSWDQSGSNRIAYSVKGSDSYYDIHFANPNGGNDTCLTCNHPDLPNRHICAPHWHPNGQWLLIVAEKTTHPGSSTDALPGFGAYCDIYLISSDGSKTFKLVDIPNDYDHGVIAPRFSPDGSKIVWTNRTAAPDVLNPKKQAGYWNLQVMDFAFDNNNEPVVSNLRTIQPAEDAFYECYGYSPDGSKLIFCSNLGQNSFLDEHIYTVDTNGNNLSKLTQKDYNEHAFYRPDGNKIVWMTNTNSNTGGTDWWMMNPDGSDKKQLTYFNVGDNEQSEASAVWAGLGSFAPEGDRFIGGVQKNLVTQEGKIVMVEIK